MNTTHPYYKEVKYSLESLNNQGFKPIGFDDGEEMYSTTNIDEIIDGVLSVDESTVGLDHNGIKVNVYFVLGNEPGVAICDYTHIRDEEVSRKFDLVCDEIYNHFN